MKSGMIVSKDPIEELKWVKFYEQAPPSLKEFVTKYPPGIKYRIKDTDDSLYTIEGYALDENDEVVPVLVMTEGILPGAFIFGAHGEDLVLAEVRDD